MDKETKEWLEREGQYELYELVVLLGRGEITVEEYSIMRDAQIAEWRKQPPILLEATDDESYGSWE